MNLVPPPSPASESNTPITLPGQQKFTPPPPPIFSAVEAWFSALSLLLFAAVSIGAIVYSLGQPWWAIAPYGFTALGSAAGFFYETWLILRGAPFQLLAPPRGKLIQALRFGNLAPVFGSAYLAYCLLTFGTTNQAGWLVIAVGVVTGVLLVLFLFRGPQQVGTIVLTLGLLAQLVLLGMGPDLAGGLPVRLWLAAAAVGLYATTLIGAETPRQSTRFHVVGTVVVVLLFFGLRTEFAQAGDAAHRASTGIGLRLLGAIPLGALVAFRWFPNTWALLRSHLANFVWPLFYLIIAGGLRIPRPERLGDLYRGREDELRPLSLLPYHLAHPRNLTHPVSVPCLDEALTLRVHAFGFLTRLVQFVFAAASVVGRFFPFADIDRPLGIKPRMEPWSDGSHYWPRWLLKRIYIPRLGWFSIESGVRGPGFQATPATALEAYQRGQLLAFLVEYGIAGTFVEPVVRDGQHVLQMDLAFFEKYETKPDYEPYGGTAYFQIDDQQRCLKLTHVRAPRSTVLLEVDPTDATFRHAEDMILATVYFYVVSGKHLVEIHMGLNLVEVALFNAFDAKREWHHPVRMALYPHLFAHELAEELTTQNLLEDKAVFPQIFATTNAALMRHLNDRFSEYQLARDEDFEHRERVLLTGRDGARLEDVLPRSSLVWEKEYARIWREYADQLVQAAFADDNAVSNDECLRVLYANLASMFQRELPARYDQLRTRAGLSLFISDTMHHLIIRHEVYGTSGVRLALDPRINKVQVPKDGGPYAIDEWRSLACVAMATSRVRYTQLMTDFSNTFEDLRDPATKARYKEAFDRLQSRLQELEAKYRSDGVNNYETLRLLPSELDIGAGY